MLTNLIPAVVIIKLLTNVVESDNHSGCEGSERGYYHATLGHFCTPYTPPTERYITTNVVEYTTLRWKQDGVDKELSSDRIISSVCKVLKLKTSWEEAGLRTNDVVNSSNFFTPMDWKVNNNLFRETK